MLHIEPIPCLRDNYAYLVIDTDSGTAAVVDPSEAEPVLRALQRQQLRLTAMWLTHHHWDHIGGIVALQTQCGPLPVYASCYDAEHGRVPAQSEALQDGQRFAFGTRQVQALCVPGHTLGALAYHVGDDLFTGDTLFLGGCGRLFEGSAAQMHASLLRLAALPAQTKVWCGHEYTRSNLAFARHVDPDNAALAARYAALPAQQAGRIQTVPGSIHEELATNPFLRCATLAAPHGLAPDDAFAALRRGKDGWPAQPMHWAVA
ncbi:MAG: hydroxyacylglutathione hydrolase [Polyangiales bacterium]